MVKSPAEGDVAPGFDLPADGGGRISLPDLRGRVAVVYFYPKDDTSGCTKEALDFSRAKPDFDAIGVPVVGISPDGVRKHDRFKEKHGLDIVLASDEDHRASEAYGVWVEKSMYGRKYMGIERSTFLIDREGNIARAWRKVKVPGHVEEVLAAAGSLTRD